jgi:hypothetical protein
MSRGFGSQGTADEQNQQEMIEMENKEIDNQDVAEPDQMASGAAGTGQANATDSGTGGDLFFALYDRQEKMAGWLNKKIVHLGHRLTVPEERR